MRKGKKRNYHISISILGTILLIVLIAEVINLAATGKFIEDLTAKATSATTSASIAIDATPPSLIVTSPTNTTYNKRIINLNFSASDTNPINTSYSLNGHNNQSITGNTTFEAQYGTNTLKVHTTDTVNHLNTSTITFFNKRFLYYNYSKFNNNNYGSTNLSYHSQYEDESSNISNLSFANAIGRISFKGLIALTAEADFDTHMNISNTRVFVNSSNMSFLNQSAVIVLTNLTLTNPRILLDNTVCPADTCTNTSYSSAGVFIFTVAHFSTYDIEETPTSDSGTSGSSSTEGRTSTAAKGKSISVITNEQEHIEIKQTIIKVNLIQGKAVEQSLWLKNAFNKTINMTIDFTDLRDFMQGNRKLTQQLSLNPGEEQTLHFSLIASEDSPLWNSNKKITITEKDQKKTISYLIEVTPAEYPFDISITPENAEVYSGSELRFQVDIQNKKANPENIEINYELKDNQNNTITQEKENKEIERKITFTKTMHIPQETSSGIYTLYVTINGTASKSSNITITRKEKEPAPSLNLKVNNLLKIGILSIVILITVGLWFYIKRKMKKELYKNTPKK
ncbi:hypothetical protein HZA98_00015 [Candidatus Woesearchaeota archaeon]|nr:hypothetical protein [Candidatus Woesearchaeota archaeon]